MIAHARLGEGDCERLRDGVLAQPFNAISSLGFVLAAATTMRRALRSGGVRFEHLLFPAVVGGTGIGSFLWHGPQPRCAKRVHDVSMALLLLYLSVFGAPWRGRWRARAYCLCCPAVAALIAARPRSTTALHGLLALAAVTGEAATYRRGLRPLRRAGQRTPYARALAATAAGGTALLLGRTGSPLCDPDRPAQLHGLWHLLAAVALNDYFSAIALPGEQLRG
jgi:hypothetical protein